MKKILILFLFFSQFISAVDFTSYLTKITNNSSKPFFIYCFNFKWQPVLFASPVELNATNPNPDLPKTSGDVLEEKRAQLLQDKANIVTTLTQQSKTTEQIAQNPQIKAIDKQIDDLTKQLRPVVKPNSTLDNLPCRLFSDADIPTDKPKNWQMPQTFLKQGGIKLEIIDTHKKNDCPEGFLKIEARSSNQINSVCIDTTQGLGKIHLIINKDDSFKLEAIKDTSIQATP
jgi:hypothetical protein